MKKFFNILIFISITIILLISFSFSDQVVIVKTIIDGDTIILSNQKRLRYIGIDSPEIHYKSGNAEPFGREAKEINKQLLSGKTIRITYDMQKKDRFGRILAYVYTADGLFINNEIIRKGCAWVLFKKPNIRHYRKFLISQRHAMSQKLGMWHEWREKEGMRYIGNVKSKRFHRMNCPYGSQTAAFHRKLFQKKWDAFYAGFSPCRKCIIKHNE